MSVGYVCVFLCVCVCVLCVCVCYVCVCVGCVCGRVVGVWLFVDFGYGSMPTNVSCDCILDAYRHRAYLPVSL